VVDPDKASRLLVVLLDAIADLRRYHQSVTREELRSSRDKQHMVLHALYVAVQAAVDLAQHWAADRGLAQPSTYQAAFRNLEEAQLLPPELAERLASWAGFRNVLAPFYPVIDYDRVHAALGELSELEAFAALVAGQLSQSG
jgi:uncharacterized protein YutE (UPF0331/DUF86 family)